MKLGKFAALLVIAALAASSFTMVNASLEEDIAKPSVPDFTVTIVAHPYDVPEKTTTTIDQYTGKETTTITPGYHVENKSIEIKIKNQPFTPYIVTSHTGINHETGETFAYERNNTVNLFYRIGVKGHYGTDIDWKSVGSAGYTYETGPKSNVQYGAEYTTITVNPNDYPAKSLLDFRVKAVTGYYIPYGRNVLIFGYDFYGQESEWSLIQTLTLGEVGTTAVTLEQPAPTETLTPSPTETVTTTPTLEPTQNQITTQATIEQTGVLGGLNWETTIAIVSIIIVGLVAALVLSKRRRKTPNSTC